MDGHSSGTPVTERLARPTRAATRKHRCRLPGVPPLFGLAPGGVCRAASVAGRAVGSYPTVSPLPDWFAARKRAGPAVCSLWHFPWGRPRRPLTGTVSPWSPDFPHPAGCPRSAAIQPSDLRRLTRAAPPTWSSRPASSARVSGSAMPSTCAGRKWRWKAFTISPRRHGDRRRDSRSAAAPCWKSPSSGRPPALGHRPMPACRQRLPGKAPAGIDLALRARCRNGRRRCAARSPDGARGCRGRARSAPRSAAADSRGGRRAG